MAADIEGCILEKQPCGCNAWTAEGKAAARRIPGSARGQERAGGAAANRSRTTGIMTRHAASRPNRDAAPLQPDSSRRRLSAQRVIRPS